MRADAAKRTLIGLGAVALLVLGIWWGGHPADLPSFLRDAFVANPHDRVIDEALSDIQSDWYRKTGRNALIDGAISGAVASLNDPYAEYQTPKQFNAFNNPLAAAVLRRRDRRRAGPRRPARLGRAFRRARGRAPGCTSAT